MWALPLSVQKGSNKSVTKPPPSDSLHQVLLIPDRHSERHRNGLPRSDNDHQIDMLIKTSYRDVETKADGRAGKMRIFVIEPNVPEYPDAKFPGCTSSSASA